MKFCPQELTDIDERYAFPWDVCAGRITASKRIRQACQRHITDLDRDDITFSVPVAQSVVEWMETKFVFVGGETDGEDYRLLPWAHWVVTSLFGWLRPDGYRRFRRAMVFSAKGSSKSPLAALIGLRMSFGDGEAGSQGFVVAATSEQASVLFNYAVQMSDRSDLAHGVTRIGGHNPYNLVTNDARCFLRKFSGATKDAKGKSGWSPHILLADELHEFRDASNLDSFVAGRKWRKQPLVFITSNAGIGVGTVAHREYLFAVKVLDGTHADDTYFAAVFECDEGDDPYKDESCWIKANPSLPHTPGINYLREQVARAAGVPSVRSEVDRLNFGRWAEAGAPFVEVEAWDAVESDELTPAEGRLGVPCFASLDLSKSRDLTAGALVWDHGDFLEAEITAWTPADTVITRAERDGTPYYDWIEAGHIQATPGKVVDYSHVLDWLKTASQQWQLELLAYDPWRIVELEREGQRADLPFSRIEGDPGIWVVPHGQGFVHQRPRDTDPEDTIRLWMPRSLRHTETAIMDTSLRVLRNPVVRSGVLGLVLREDLAGNRVIDREKASVKIDAGVALVMAVGAALEYRETHGEMTSLEGIFL